MLGILLDERAIVWYLEGLYAADISADNLDSASVVLIVC